MFQKSVPKKVSQKNVPKNVPKKCPKEVSQKSVPKKYPKTSFSRKCSKKWPSKLFAQMLVKRLNLWQICTWASVHSKFCLLPNHHYVKLEKSSLLIYMSFQLFAWGWMSPEKVHNGFLTPQKPISVLCITGPERKINVGKRHCWFCSLRGRSGKADFPQSKKYGWWVR